MIKNSHTVFTLKTVVDCMISRKICPLVVKVADLCLSLFFSLSYMSSLAGFSPLMVYYSYSVDPVPVMVTVYNEIIHYY